MATKKEQNEYNESLRATQSLNASIISQMQKINEESSKRGNLLSNNLDQTRYILESIQTVEDIDAARNVLLDQRNSLTKVHLGLEEDLKNQALALIDASIAVLDSYKKQEEIIERVSLGVDGITESFKEMADNIMSSLKRVPLVGKTLAMVFDPFYKSIEEKLDKINNDLKQNFYDAFINARSSGEGFVSSFKNGIQSMISETKIFGIQLNKVFLGINGTVLLIVGALAAIAVAGVSAYKKIASAASDFRKETGLLRSQTVGLENDLNGALISTVGLGASAEDVSAAASSFTTEFENIRQPSEAVLENLVTLNKNFGVSVQSAAAVNKLFQNMGGYSADTAQYMTQQVAQASALAGVAPNQVIKDIAENSEDMYKYFGGSVQNMTKAAIQAAKMGYSLKQMARSADSLLDFESSITNQMEASAILGRNLNLNQARYYAMTGDTAKAQESIAREVDKLGNLTRLNVFQQEALAKATGVPFEDLVNQQRIRKQFGKLDKEQLAAANKLIDAGKDISDISSADLKKETEKIKKQQEMQSEFDQMKNKLVEIGYVLLQSLMPVGKAIMSAVEPTVKFLDAFIQPLKSAMTLLSNTVTGITEPFKELFAGSEMKSFAIGLTDIGRILSAVIIYPLNLLSGILKSVSLGVAGIIKIFVGLGKAIIGLFTGDLGSAKAGMQMFLNGIVDSIRGWLGWFLKIPIAIIESIGQIFPSLSEQIQKGKDVINSFVDAIKSLFKFESLETAKQKFKDFVDSIKSLFSFGDKSSEEFGKIESASSGLFGQLMLTSALLGTLAKKFSGTFSGLGKLFTAPFKALSGFGKLLISPLKTFSSIGGKLLTTPFKALSGVGKFISTPFKMLLSPLKTFSTIGGKLLTTPFKALSGVGKFISTPFKLLTSPLKGFGGMVGKFLISPLKTFSSIGGKLLTAPFKMLLSPLKLVSNLLLSPFKLLGKLGGLITKPFSLLTSKIGGLGKLTSAGGGFFTRMFKGITSGIGSLARTIGSAFSSVASGIGRFLSSVISGISSALTSLGTGIGTFISSVATGIGTALTSLGTGLGGFLRGIAGGLSALVGPAAIGLGILVLAIMGIATALRIAGPYLESFGNMMKSIFEGIASVVVPVVETVVNGITNIASVIGQTIIGALDSVGNTLSVLLDKVTVGKVAGIMALGPALMSLSVGLAALSGGGLFSNLADGIGSLFGGDSPAEKLEKLAQHGAGISILASGMELFSQSIGSVMQQMDLLDIEKFEKFAEASGDALNQAFDGANVSMNVGQIQTPEMGMEGSLSAEFVGLKDVMTMFTETTTNKNNEIIQKLDELKQAYLQNKDMIVDGQKLTNSVTTRQQQTSTNQYNTLNIVR